MGLLIPFAIDKQGGNRWPSPSAHNPHFYHYPKVEALAAAAGSSTMTRDSNEFFEFKQVCFWGVLSSVADITP